MPRVGHLSGCDRYLGRHVENQDHGVKLKKGWKKGQVTWGVTTITHLLYLPSTKFRMQNKQTSVPAIVTDTANFKSEI